MGDNTYVAHGRDDKRHPMVGIGITQRNVEFSIPLEGRLLKVEEANHRDFGGPKNDNFRISWRDQGPDKNGRAWFSKAPRVPSKGCGYTDRVDLLNPELQYQRKMKNKLVFDFGTVRLIVKGKYLTCDWMSCDRRT